MSYKFRINSLKTSLLKTANNVRNGVRDSSMVKQPMQFFLTASCTEVVRHRRPRSTRFVLVLALLAGAIIFLMPAARGATPDIGSRWMLINTSCTAGKYPLESRLNGHQGTTVLQFRIAPDGSVKSIRIEKSSGHRELDLTA